MMYIIYRAPLKIDDRGSRQGARVRKTAVYWV